MVMWNGVPCECFNLKLCTCQFSYFHCMHLSIYVPSIICYVEIIFFLLCLFLDMNIFQKIRGENDNLCIALKMVSLEVIRI